MTQSNEISGAHSQITGWMRQAGELHQNNKLQEAQNYYLKVLQANPDHVHALHMLGVMALQVKQYRNAVECIGKAVSLAPKIAAFHCNHASAFIGVGEFENALNSCDLAITANPAFVQAHMKRGEVFELMKQYPEAIRCFDKAIAIAPEFAEAWLNRGNLKRNMGDMNDALLDLQQVLRLNPSHEPAANVITAILLEQNRYTAAYQHIQETMEKYPDRVLLKTALANVLRKLVPEWHIPMMNESARNEAYFKALRQVIKPDSLVLDIGTGSGLLAMMAAQLGAAKVVSCESVPLIANVAVRIISDNGLADKVEVVNKLSSNLVIGDDLPAKADILVSEIFANDLLGEHVLPALEDAKQRLVKEDAVIIPANGSLMIALFGGEYLGKKLWVDQVSGFDLRHFNSIRSKHQNVLRTDLKPVFFSEPVQGLHFDFLKENSWPATSKLLRVKVNKSGLCYGIMQWIRFELVPGVVYENHPLVEAKESNWQHVVYLFDEPRQMQEGEVLTIKAEHIRNTPWFEVTQDQ